METENDSRIWNWVFRRIIIGPLVFTYFRVKTTRMIRLPRHGAVLFLIGPHLTEFESLVVASVLRKYLVRFLAKSSYWDKGIVGWFMRRSGQIPVDRDSRLANKQAIDRSVEILLAGGKVALYPEGTRGHDGKVHKGRSIAAHIVRAVQREGGTVTVVPVGMTGMLKLQPRGKKIPRPGRIGVHFGVPIPYDLSDGASMDAFTRRVMWAVAALADTGYVDEYLEFSTAPSK